MAVPGRIRALLGVLAAAAVALPASAAAQTDVVVWSGERLPDGELTGVRVLPNGSARVLAPRNRAKGTVKVVKSYSPTPGQLRAIRAAAKSALTGKNVAGTNRLDGFYTAAVVEVDGKTRALLGANALPAKLRGLADAVFTSLPPAGTAAARARAMLRRVRVRMRAASLPDTASCAPGQEATRIAREVSLKQAAALGMVRLQSKGLYDDDGMAVTVNFKDVPLPTMVRMDIELVSDIHDVEVAVENVVESRLAGLKIESGPLAGQPVNFDLNVHRRLPTEPPRPCWHQLNVSEDRNLRQYLKHDEPDPIAGELSVYGRSSWTHEALHIAGLRDRYDEYFMVGKSGLKLPLNTAGGLGEFITAKLGEAGVGYPVAFLTARPQPGWEGDIMADSRNGKVSDADLKELALLGQDRINVHAEPGEILVSKDGQKQNLANGEAFDLTVTRDGPPAHRDGMYVYCVDHARGTPFEGAAFDVLGPAAELGDPAMSALARVLDVVARRRKATLGSVPGAQGAVWRVTDDTSPDLSQDPDARSILEEAGIEPDPFKQKFNAPHYGNPNGGSPDTGAITPSSVVGPPALGPTLPRVARPRPRLSRVAVSPRRMRRARRVLVALRITLAVGAGDRITVTLERAAGRRFRRVRRLAKRRVGDGQTTLPLLLRGLKPGSYRVRVKGSRGRARLASFRVL